MTSNGARFATGRIYATNPLETASNYSRLRSVIGTKGEEDAPRLNNYNGTFGTPLARMTNQVTHGDCLNVLRKLPTSCADMVLTDPPYLVRYTARDGQTIANDDNDAWLLPAFTKLYRILKPNTYCVSFYCWSQVDKFLVAWKKAGFRPVAHMVWVKNYASSVRQVQTKHETAYLLAKGQPPLPSSPPPDVLPWKYTGNRLHPTQKPVDSLTPLVTAFARPGGLIVDPFGGSGSTGAAARLCGCRFLLIEKEAKHQRTAQRRLVLCRR